MPTARIVTRRILKSQELAGILHGAKLVARVTGDIARSLPNYVMTGITAAYRATSSFVNKEIIEPVRNASNIVAFRPMDGPKPA